MAVTLGVDGSVTIEPAGRRVIAGAGAADLTVTGSATDLYLLLWNRRGTDGLDLRGDRAVPDLWREKPSI